MNIFVAGHNGMVGSAIVRLLLKNQKNKVFTASRKTFDLKNSKKVLEYLNDNSIDQIYLAAAKVGGIKANSDYPVDFLYENLSIQNSVISSAHTANVKSLMFLGSSCIYPKFSKQPINEKELLSGYLEETNEPYAIAKIAGIKLCQAYNKQYQTDFRALMPTNLYGPNDNYDLSTSHVLPALIKKINDAKEESQDEVEIWGSGEVKREFLHVDDLANASVYFMNLSKKSFFQHNNFGYINIGTGEDIKIIDLAKLIADVVQFKGSFKLNRSMPDGTPRKLLDIALAKNLGWQAEINLRQGIESAYNSFITGEKE